MLEPRTSRPIDEAALRGAAKGTASPGTDVLRGERPPLLDAALVRAVTSVLMLALVAAAYQFRARTSLLGFDLILLLLRTLSVAFAVRAVLSVAGAAATLSADGAARRSALVLGDVALMLAIDGREWFVHRDDVLAVVPVVHGRAQSRVAARGEVQLVRRAPHPPLVIPPWFAASHELLAARLRRWLGPAAENHGPPAPSGDPEQRYARLAGGGSEAAAVVVPEGTGYLARAPYATLLAIGFVADVYLHAGNMRPILVVPASAACVLALGLFAGWVVWMARRRRSRLGVGLVLTREELLARGKAGVVAVPWPQLRDIEVDARSAWSPMLGAIDVRTLQLVTHDGQVLLFDGGFLGFPVEVVAALCDAYRDGRVDGSAS